ncbi:MAG: outer membrane lipoprotein LolB [Coxiellaceae bacterium]|nr:MAG: outer membrane lipoprotein LolB [Coxiellaceae bacterium]
MKILRVSLILLTIILSGCATVSLPAPMAAPTTISKEQREAALYSLENWSLTSALSLRQPQKALLASLVWQQQGQHYTQVISGPFNVGSVRIEGMPGQVTLWRSAKLKYTASSPEELMQKQLGWQLPVSNMYYWVRGVAIPNVPATREYDNQGHLIGLNQAGWQIMYSDYKTIGNVDLPGKIELRSGQLQVKLVIKRWRV